MIEKGDKVFVTYTDRKERPAVVLSVIHPKSYAPYEETLAAVHFVDNLLDEETYGCFPVERLRVE